MMLKQTIKKLGVKHVDTWYTRCFSTTKPTNFKVAVCGANGGIGQPLSLLLKLNKMISDLKLYDIKGTPGVAADLSHVDTCCDVSGFMGLDRLCNAIYGVDIVVVCAGMARKPGMTRDDLFGVNAAIVAEIVGGIAQGCGCPLIAIISNPVNSLIPLSAEVLKKHNAYDPKRLFGVSTLDMVRARTFIGESEKVHPQAVKVDVVCGHSGITIIPVLSRSKPKYTGDPECLTKRIQTAGDEVVKAKAGAGSATLAMAHAGALFVNALLRAMNGECNVVECAFVESCVSETDYFSTPLLLGKDGIVDNLGLPKLNELETSMMKKAIPELKKNIQKGVDFVKNMGKKKPEAKK